MVRAVPKTPWHKPQMTDQAAAPRDLANAIRALAMDAVQQAELRPSRHADGHGRRRHGAVHQVPEVRPDRSRTGPTATASSCRPATARCCSIRCCYLTGYPDMTLEELKHFRQLGAKTAGHPEYGHASGIETTTGPLGQGLGNSVGLALAERLLADALRRRSGRPLHLRDRRRRLPDGRHRPGSHHARPAISGSAA